jgi:hypothetical protein
MLTRYLFALLALAALVILLSGSPGGIPESEPLPRRLLLVGVLSMGIGMALPWGRWITLVSPGRNLPSVIKLLGWGGASAVPSCLNGQAWFAAGFCLFLPVCAFSLWKGRRWAAWPWYGIAVVCLVLALWGLYSLFDLLFSDVDISGSRLWWTVVITIIWTMFCGSIAIEIVRELTAWLRSSRSLSQAPSLPSSG